MKRVLVITSILPVADVQHKKDENDVLLVIEDEILKREKKIEFQYVYLFSNIPICLSWLKPKWKDLYNLKQKSAVNIQGRNVRLLPLILLPGKKRIRKYFYQFSIWSSKRKLANIIKELEPNIVHAQDAEASAMVARQISEIYDIPYVVTLRGGNNGVDKLKIKNIEGASSLIALSPVQLNQFRPWVNSKVELIPHGLSSLFINAVPKIRQLNSPLRLVVVARLIKLKNLDKVIEAINELNLNFCFDIYGSGLEEENLKKRVAELGLRGQVKLKGRISNVELPTVLPDYDLFVMPSYPESLGRVYFEAMACGLPVVCAKNTGIDGIVTHEKEGFVVDINEPHSLTELFAMLNKNPDILLSLKQNAYNLSQDYGWDYISRKYIEVYQIS